MPDAQEPSYDALYTSRAGQPLWGRPGRLVVKYADLLPAGSRVLDAGCGDGKNAVYLAARGHRVVAFDYSAIAVGLARDRCVAAQVVVDLSVLSLRDFCSSDDSRFDAIVSYGLFHCLPADDRVALHRSLVERLIPGGHLFFSALTSELPLPPDHLTPGVVLAKGQEIDAVLEGLDVIDDFRGVINEDHLPAVGPHTHAARWVLARSRA